VVALVVVSAKPIHHSGLSRPAPKVRLALRLRLSFPLWVTLQTSQGAAAFAC
jgi:hypothetical protein